MSDLVLSLFDGRWPQVIAFDLDGTLVDSAPDLAVAIDAMLNRLGRPPAGAEKVGSWVGNGAQMLVRRALADSDDPLQVAQVDDVLQAEGLALFREEYHQVNGDLSCLYPGVETILDRWQERGSELVVITNKPRPFAEPLLDKLGILDRFVLVVGGECLPEKKPHPMPMLHVANLLGVEPDAMLMVGDSRHDVGAARAAGVPVICRRGGYNHGEDIAESRPDAVFDCFTELF